jgi:hypothetical protein
LKSWIPHQVRNDKAFCSEALDSAQTYLGNRGMKVIHILLALVISFNYLLFAQSDTIFYDPYVDTLMMQVSGNNINQHIQDLANANGHQSRVTYTPGNEWSANYIKQAFESYTGLTSVEFDTFFIFNAPAPYDTIPLVNVVATLEGISNPSQIYIIGGHFDATANLDPNYTWDTDWPTAIAPGADDNATGVASILEIARILSDNSNNFLNDATIKFIAFGAEERHPAYNNQNHWGSRAYVIDAFSNGDDILGAYIVDMIGFNDTGNDYFNIASDNDSRPLGRRLLEANQVYQVGLGSNGEPFPEVTYSDHDQFWIYGYKAVLLIENAPPWNNNPPWYTANPYYHKQTDTPDKVNLNQVVKDTKLMLATIAHLSTNVTSINPPSNLQEIPVSYKLHQNYPNPFNPSTTIEFELKIAQRINLEIFDFSGRKVVTLIDEQMGPGQYKTIFDASNFASGIYFYRLKSENFSSVKKMVLMK